MTNQHGRSTRGPRIQSCDRAYHLTEEENSNVLEILARDQLSLSTVAWGRLNLVLVERITNNHLKALEWNKRNHFPRTREPKH